MVRAPDQMLPGENAQGLKGAERCNREEALKREITRRVARGESFDGLLGYISGLLVEVASPTRKISFEMIRRRMGARCLHRRSGRYRPRC